MDQLDHSNAALEVEEAGSDALVLHFSGDLDLAGVQQLEPQITTLLERSAESVVVDMGKLTFMDTSGVALLVRISNHFGPLTLEGVTPIVRRAIEALGLTERLRLPES